MIFTFMEEGVPYGDIISKIKLKKFLRIQFQVKITLSLMNYYQKK